MPRIARVVVPYYPHHITQRGTNKSDIFLEEKDYAYFLTCLNEWIGKTKVSLWAYCLMKNHFHLLVSPSDPPSLGRCLHGISFRYAQYFNNKYNRSGRLWQNRYFSCPVDKNEYLWSVVKYIEMNPVRAGLSKKPEQWKWSSAQEHFQGLKDCHVGLYYWLTEEERKEYVRSSLSTSKENEIRKATATGRPFCDESVLDQLEKKLNRNLRAKRSGRPRKRVS